MRLAIGFDHVETTGGSGPQSFCNLWKQAADAAGIEAEIVDPLAPGAIDRIAGFDAFMWRYNFVRPWIEAAPRIMRVLEDDLSMPVWPQRVLRDIFENKIAQSYLLDGLDIPHPRTWVFWDRDSALAALDTLPYPVVTKLSRGVQSRGVRLIRTRREAETLIGRMFSFGLGAMDYDNSAAKRLLGRYATPLTQMRRGEISGHLERGYVLFQEFLENNTHDMRMVLQGDRVFATRRKNREGDFRASGSGIPDLDPDAINPRAIELAFRLADAMGVRSLVMDAMFRGEEPVITEMAYTMAIGPTREWPFHWERTKTGIVRRDEGFDWPTSIFEDFVAPLTVRDKIAL